MHIGADLAVAYDGQNPAGVLVPVIAGERSRGAVKPQLNACPRKIAERLARLARAHALLLHERAEAFLVHSHALFLHHLVRQVKREAVGVIQLERVRAGEHLFALGLMLREQICKNTHPGVDRLVEVFLLRFDDAGDIALLLTQLRILALVFMHHGIHHTVEERIVFAQQLAVARGATQQAAQDIAAPLVRREHAVADHHDGRTDVVGNDAQGDVRLMAVAIVRAGDLADLVGDVHHRIHVKQGVHALTDDRQTLQAHAGVDVFLREIGIVAVAVVVELGKDVVPDLHIPVAVAARCTVRLAAAVFLPAVKVDLGAGAARAGAMLPEVVVLAEADDTRFRNPDLIAPDIECLVVVFIYGRIQPRRVETDPVRRGKKLPRPCDRFVLEVVAEGEVAEHLEICAMARGFADVLNVAGTDALLAGADAVAQRLLLALEIRLHRRHAGVDQQQRRVVLRDQRKAGQAQMPLRFKEAQKHLTQFIQTEFFHIDLPKKRNSRPRNRGESESHGTTLIAPCGASFAIL